MADFEMKLEILGRLSPGRVEGVERVRDAAIYVHDTLELALAAARSVFGKDVDPHVAFEVYDRIEQHRMHLIQTERPNDE